MPHYKGEDSCGNQTIPRHGVRRRYCRLRRSGLVRGSQPADEHARDHALQGRCRRVRFDARAGRHLRAARSSDYDAFFEDTMHAGHYENRRESVDIMIRSSRSVINDLLAMGVDFERKADAASTTREARTAAHASPSMPILRARRLRPSCSRLSASWTTCRFSNTLP